MKIKKIGQLVVTVLVSIMFITLVRSVRAQQLEQKTEPNAGSILNPIHSELLSKTQVPMRMPSYIPFAGDPANPLYGILKSANRTNYEIELSWSPDCSGGNYCHFGTIRGSLMPLSEEEGRKEKPVHLRGGIRGTFLGFGCSASCDDSTLLWSEGKFHYSMSIKGGREADVINMVNSALPVDGASK